MRMERQLATVAKPTVADPAPAPAVADSEDRQRDPVELEKEKEERQRDRVESKAMTVFLWLLAWFRLPDAV